MLSFKYIKRINTKVKKKKKVFGPGFALLIAMEKRGLIPNILDSK